MTFTSNFDSSCNWRFKKKKKNWNKNTRLRWSLRKKYENLRDLQYFDLPYSQNWRLENLGKRFKNDKKWTEKIQK